MLSSSPETRDSLLLRLRDEEDHEAWCQFTAIYRPLVYRIARKRGLQDADAQDLAQRVLLRVAGAIERWEADEQGARFRTWLHTVARNAVVDHFRSLKKDAAEGGSSAMLRLKDAVESVVDDEEVDREYQRELFRWAAREVRDEFAEETWQAFWRTAVENEPVATVAKSLGKSNGAVYIARSRVMQRLREKVLEYEETIDV